MTILDSITSFLRREETEIAHEDEELDVEEQLQETRYSLTEMGSSRKTSSIITNWVKQLRLLQKELSL